MVVGGVTVTRHWIFGFCLPLIDEVSHFHSQNCHVNATVRARAIDEDSNQEKNVFVDTNVCMGVSKDKLQPSPT